MATVIKHDSLTLAGKAPQPAAFNVEDVRSKARDYLLDIQEQAEEILSNARSEAEALRVSAKQEATAEANQEFESRVTEAAKKLSDNRCKTAVAGCQKMVSGIEESTSQWLSIWRSQTVTLAAKIAEKIVRRELDENNDLLSSWLEEALIAMRDSRELKILINPDDFEVAGEYLKKLTKSVPQAADAELHADPDIARGGCIVRSNNGTIDQTLETQLSRLVEQLN